MPPSSSVLDVLPIPPVLKNVLILFSIFLFNSSLIFSEFSLNICSLNILFNSTNFWSEINLSTTTFLNSSVFSLYWNLVLSEVNNLALIRSSILSQSTLTIKWFNRYGFPIFSKKLEVSFPSTCPFIVYNTGVDLSL